ncbi:hypothetical protein, partial [Sphingorhabdus sp.]|uniref:hypothetical protein n=1 Tax=Sphingorhabdus sp. TaxID=1902408 RepID=UPI00391C156E
MPLTQQDRGESANAPSSDCFALVIYTYPQAGQRESRDSMALTHCSIGAAPHKRKGPPDTR